MASSFSEEMGQEVGNLGAEEGVGPSSKLGDQQEAPCRSAPQLVRKRLYVSATINEHEAQNTL